MPPARADLPSAGLWRRLAAMVYDALLLAGLLFAATALLLPFTGGEAVIGIGTGGRFWYRIYLLAVVVLFFGWFWTRDGQTLGMKAWRLRVQDADGRPPDWPRALLRLAAALLALAPAGLGYWWMLVDRERKTWHDRLSGTEVVLLPKAAESQPR